jgi:hypothetical protein
VRLYDQRGDSFCWGSWIKSDGAPSGFGVESALMIYDFALQLGFRRAHFDVRKQNTSVCQFHERFGAVKVDESQEDYFYEMRPEAIARALQQYRKYLPDGGAPSIGVKSDIRRKREPILDPGVIRGGSSSGGRCAARLRSRSPWPAP